MSAYFWKCHWSLLGQLEDGNAMEVCPSAAAAAAACIEFG
jgi:hypothetical protein